MKTQLHKTQLFIGKKIKLLLLILLSLCIQQSYAALSALGLTTASATLDPMSSGTTTLVAINVNDGASIVSSIGFTFNLNGTNYTQFSVNSNGLMRLGATVVSTSATNSLASATDSAKVAPYWDDLKTVAGTVRSRLVGSAPARKLVIDWNVTIVNTNTAVQFQAWLFETSNNIQFVYGAMPTNPGLYSVGLATSTTNFSSITVAGTFASSTVSTVAANNSNNTAIAASNSYLYTPAPACPVLVSPTGSSVPTSTSLNWTPGATGTTTFYEVFFGTAANPPSVANNVLVTTYNPGILSNNQLYFWKILGKNGTIAVAQSTGCPTNQFTTVALPSCATNLSPAHTTTNLPLQDTLKWSAGAGVVPTGYDVYFGTINNPPKVSPNQAGTTFFPGYLSWNTTYYWKIVPKNGNDEAAGCTVSQFTTRARPAYEVTRSTGIAYNSISGTGTSVGSWRNVNNTDDNLSNALPIGFNFTYNGTTYSSFLVGINGFITFNTSVSTNGASASPYGYLSSNLYGGTPTSPALLAPFYDDITCQGGQSNLQSNLDNCIKYTTTGSVGNRILTVEWRGMEFFNTAGPDLNFQVKLFEGTNAIDFIYGPMDAFDGTFNLSYSYSSGINATAVSTTTQDGEFFNQQTANTRDFGSTPQSQLAAVPECNSKLHFTPGAYTAYIPVSQVPPNDSMGAPIHLNVNATPCMDICGIVYKSALATFSKVATCGGNPDDDVWFDFIATNANTTIRVNGSGSYDPILELFNNSMVSIGCANTAGNGLGLSETITSNSLVVGQKYIIRVYNKALGYGLPGSGEFSICVSGIPNPPPNDNCISAISIPISATLTPGTNTFAATASTGIPSCGLPNGENPDDDVWYKFTAARTAQIITVAAGNGFNAVVQLLNGTCGALSNRVCVNSFSTGQVETINATGLTINANYYIRIFHAGIGGGSGTYSLSVSTPAPGCTDLVLPPNGQTEMSASGIDLIWDPVFGADNYIIKFDTVNPPVRTLTTTTDTTVFTGFLKQSETYYWKIIPGNGISYNNTCELDSFMTEETPVQVTVRVFLQNLYIGSQHMKTVLSPADTIADTIVINLYDDLNEWQYSSIALLSTNGYATGYFPLLALDSPYYFVVSHRNSLEIWTAIQYTLTMVNSFDLSASPASVYGGNVIQMGPGVYALKCGDMNQDGYVNRFDVTQVGEGAKLFEVGYFTEDFNADGYVESLDLSLLENLVPLALQKKTPFPPFGP